MLRACCNNIFTRLPVDTHAPHRWRTVVVKSHLSDIRMHQQDQAGRLFCCGHWSLCCHLRYFLVYTLEIVRTVRLIIAVRQFDNMVALAGAHMTIRHFNMNMSSVAAKPMFCAQPTVWPTRSRLASSKHERFDYNCLFAAFHVFL